MPSSQTSITPVGKGCAVLFFTIFALIGLAVFAGIGWAFFDGARTYFWSPTPCEILSSSIRESGNKYALDVVYRYQFEGREYQSSRIGFSDTTFSKSRDAQKARNRFPAESTGTCYVNRSNPSDAVLERGPLWVGIFAAIPLVFVAIGVGGIITTLRGKKPGESTVSRRFSSKKNGCGPAGVRLFGFVFFGVGIAVTYGMLIRPYLDVRASQDWREVPCTIISSRVEYHSGSKGGGTYSIDVRYKFIWENQEMTGDRYSFDAGSSSSRDWRVRVVQQLPPGTKTVCYVNPNDPLDSVLVRKLGSDVWFGLIPLIFVVAGLAIMWNAGKIVRTGPKSVTPRAPAFRATAGPHGAVKLSPSATPLAKFIGLTLAALFWNGIVWVIILNQNGGIWTSVFLGLFALIGLLIAAGAGYCCLALFNPKPSLSASSASAIPGDTLRIDYSFTGNVRRISKLTVTLDGRESATYRRGTSTTTDRSVFARIPILETSDRGQIAAGTLQVNLPADALHSFKTANNEIAWYLNIHGDISNWPDVSLEFPIEVAPSNTTPCEPREPSGQPPVLIGEGSLKIGLVGGRDAFRPGETIEGAALWELDAAPTLAEIRLLWHTRGKGSEDGDIAAVQRFENPLAGDTRKFALIVPSAPFSFSGRLVSVQWMVELVIEPGGRSVQAEIVVGPNGKELRLPEIPQPNSIGKLFQKG